MNYSHEQLSQALYLIHELELTEIERKRQGVLNPWVQYDEALALISKRLTWPLGMTQGVVEQLAEIQCISKNLKHTLWIRPVLALVPKPDSARLSA